MLPTCATSSLNWWRLCSSEADHRSTLVTDCSAVLATAVESSSAILSWKCTLGLSGSCFSLQRENVESKFDLQWPVARLICRCSPIERRLFIVAYDHCLRIGRAHIWMAISSANNTTRHQHYVKTIGWTRGYSWWFESDLFAGDLVARYRNLAYHSIIRMPGCNSCLGNRASGKESIYFRAVKICMFSSYWRKCLICCVLLLSYWSLTCHDHSYSTEWRMDDFWVYVWWHQVCLFRCRRCNYLISMLE